MPNLLREVEKQLGLTAGGLKKFVTDGQLSNKKFFDAILASQKALTQQANSSASTIEQANQRVANSFTSLIGAIDDKLGASKFFTGFIDGIASGIDKLSNFLGLTTQATGGGGANLDEVIRGAAPSGSQYAFPTIGPDRVTAAIGGFPNYIQEIKSLEEIKELEDGLLEIRIEQTKAIAEAVNSNKETVDILGAQNVPLNEAVGFLNLENKLIDSNIQKRKIELQQNKENLTYLEQATNYLKEQFNLNDRTAGAIVSGISGAGPNASRGMNIAQSKSLDEAAYKLILSNEKVAAAIDKSFELLFDAIDPLLDILGDLLSAINRLIGALAEGVGNAIENFADSLGIGPDSYYGGGGFIRDIETMGGGSQGGAYQPTASEALQIAAIQDLRDIVDGQDETLNNLLDAARESGNLTGVVELFKQSINNLIPSLVSAPDLQTYTDILDRLNENVATGIIGDNLQEVVDYYQKMIDETTGELPRAEAYVAVGTAELIIQELASQISGTGTSVVSDFEGISDLVTKTAQEQIDSIHFQNLTAEEQIHFRNEETVAMLNAQKIFIQLIDDEERRTDLLAKITTAEAKTLELKNKQLAALEREQQLLQLQNVESGLQALLSDFERTIEKINDLVQGLFDQVQELLFSDFSPLGPQEQFAQAQSNYESLLENAFDQEATEDDIKALQGFVNEYLSAARNVFKSSTAFTTIFEGVLGDLTGLGLQAGFNMPIQAASTLSSGAEDLLGDLPEELQTAVSDMISGLNLATLAFAQQQVEFLTTVYKIPIELKAGNFIVDTSGVNKPIDLNSSNFSLDSSRLNLSLLMSSSMFTVDTSGLNFGTITPTATAGTPNLGTITPTATAGTPYLGVVTPTVSLDTSGISKAVENAINTILETSAIALGRSTLTLMSTGAEADGQFLETTGNRISTGGFINETARVAYGNSGIGLNQIIANFYRVAGQFDPYTLAFRAEENGARFLYGYQDKQSAQNAYNFYNSSDDYTVIDKYGFRQGGLVPDPMDTIPAMLSPGEYILSPETVRRYGVSNLNRLNSGDTAALNATSDPEVKRLLAELIVAVRENDTEVNVYTDMAGQTKAGIEEFRSELRERTRRQGDKFLPARYI